MHESKLAQSAERTVKRGDHVLFHIDMGDGKFETRPGVVIQVWNPATGYVNGLAFLDGSNDAPLGGTAQALTKWITSYEYGVKPRGWSWPDDWPE